MNDFESAKKPVPTFLELEKLVEEGESVESDDSEVLDEWYLILLEKGRHHKRMPWRRGRLKRRKNEDASYKLTRRFEKGKAPKPLQPKDDRVRYTPGAFGSIAELTLKEAAEYFRGRHSFRDVKGAYDAGAKSLEALKAIELLQTYDGFSSLEKSAKFLFKMLQNQGLNKITQSMAKKIWEDISSISALVREYRLPFKDACLIYTEAKRGLKQRYRGFGEIPSSEVYARAKEVANEVVSGKRRFHEKRVGDLSEYEKNNPCLDEDRPMDNVEELAHVIDEEFIDEQ